MWILHLLSSSSECLGDANTCCDFDWDSMKSLDQPGENWNFNNIKSSYPPLFFEPTPIRLFCHFTKSDIVRITNSHHFAKSSGQLSILILQSYILLLFSALFFFSTCIIINIFYFYFAYYLLHEERDLCLFCSLQYQCSI